MFIDQACILWRTDSCGVRGNCWIYDQEKMRLYLHLLTAGINDKLSLMWNRLIKLVSHNRCDCYWCGFWFFHLLRRPWSRSLRRRSGGGRRQWNGCFSKQQRTSTHIVLSSVTTNKHKRGRIHQNVGGIGRNFSFIYKITRLLNLFVLFSAF